MNVPSKRPWFRVSLRTLFVLVTLFSVFLGWQLSIVRERQTLLKELRQRVGIQVVPADLWAKNYPAGLAGQPLARVSLPRRLLGDRAIQEIWYNWNAPLPADELARLRQVFPEANIRETLPEPCHPGCFPAGTWIATPDGPRRIETIRAGELVSAHGEAVSTATVQQVFVTDNRLWSIATQSGVLVTTETQPLVLRNHETVQAGSLQRGDQLLRWSDGRLSEVEVLSVQPTGRTERVYNLILGNSEIMLANGFLCRSKPAARTGAR